MGWDSVKGAAVKQQTRGRLQQYPQRFFKGVVLGMILVITFGCFTPLLAQSHTRIAQAIQEQVSPATPDGDEAAGDEMSEDRAPKPPPPPVIPTDISTHWAADCIRELSLQRAIPINKQKQFQPDEPATWVAITDMLNLNFPTAGAYGGASAAETALNLPSAVNVLYSYPSQYYEPERAVTRAEAVAALTAKMELPYVARTNAMLIASLIDGSEVPAYGREGVASALAGGVLVNYPEPQRFEGNRSITRGEVAALVCKARTESDLRSTIPPEWVARPQALPEQLQPDSELRGVWLTNIDSEVLFSRENLADAIQRLKAMNINTLYPAVWNSGYPLFPSPTAERILGEKQRLWPGYNPGFEEGQRDRDMLQELIELAHAEGMAVIPWFEFGFMAPSEYILREEHPDWFTQRQDGSQEIRQGVETFTWMNPLHPRTQQMLLLMMAEVLDNYEVEGIQVDDHLGMPVDMGYDPLTIDLYRQEHEGEDPPEDDTDPEWVRWRADRITEFMTKVRSVIDLRRPGAILSVSPNPHPFAYNKYLQDWPTWDSLGILDELIIQIYRNDVDRFVWELNKPATVTASRNTPTSIGLLSGLRGRPTDVELLTDQLAAVRDRNYAGVSYFFYQSLWVPGQETMEEREIQFQTSFSQPASRP
ncbi:MAG: family 10 glycosylhydrolase [Cyanobacteria bacterium P01_F01_bin.86]